MPQLNHNEVRIEVHDGVATLWRVQGLPDQWWPTKIAAEIAARAAFPDEVARREGGANSMVSFSRFYNENFI